MSIMAKITIFNKKFTTLHKTSIILMLLYLISPLDILFLQLWSFTASFIHESGHAYFNLLFGDKYVIMKTNPFETQPTTTKSIEENILIILGGMFFTMTFFLLLILLVFLIFKYKRWQYKSAIHLGTDTIGFHVNIFLFTSLLVEFISNSIPYVNSTNNLSDGGQLFGIYLHLSWIVITDPLIISIMNIFLALFFVLSYMLLISNCFYCLIKKLVTLKMKYSRPPQPL